VGNGKRSHRRLYDFSQTTAGSFNDRAEVLENLFRLFFNAASHDISRRRIKWDVPRDEQKVSEFDGLRVWTYCAWGAYRGCLLGPLKKENGLTGCEDGGQGWVGRDRGRHCSLEGWFECENMDWDRLLDQVRRDDTQSYARQPRQHGSGWRIVVFQIAYYRQYS